MRSLLFLIALLFFSSRSSAETQSNPTVKSLQDLAAMNGFEADPELVSMVENFYALPDASKLSDAEKESLFEERSIALWSSSLVEFIGLADILFQDIPPGDKAVLEGRYQANRKTLKDFQTKLNAYVFAIHPGYRALDASELQKNFRGRGIKIAVFDVFDRDLLLQQRLMYPAALIQAPLNFGRPVELNHGNTVIDVILSLAPEAEIIPVSADSATYTQALQAIVARPDIDIVNMSRAFAEEKNGSRMDKDFKTALQSLVKTRILVKSLGNSGSDLDGVLNPRRQAEGLGPVNNLFTYDLSLIKDLYQETNPGDLLLFAMNLSLFASDLALSATIPGDVAPVAERCLAIPAEGVWSPVTETFESGSSFAAPQVSALAALLLEAVRNSQNSGSAGAKQRVVHLLKASADRKGHSIHDWGLGIPSGKKSFEAL